MTYKVLEWNNSNMMYLLLAICLLYFAYEGYISIQFTKVAGIVGATGMMLLLLSKRRWYELIEAIVMFFFSYLIRLEIAQMILAMMGLIIIIYAGVSFISNKVDKNRLFQLILNWGLIICLYLVIPFIPKYSTEVEKQIWVDYWTWNVVRSDVQDYGPEDYADNREIYESVGVDENDLYIWYEWNTDVEALTTEKGKIISSLQAKNRNIFCRAFSAENVFGFLKAIPLEMLKIDVFVVFLALLLFLAISLKNKKECLYLIVYTMVPIYILNYYMYISERFFQHRVDVALIYCAICIMFVILIERDSKMVKIEKKRFIVFVLLLTISHTYWQDDFSMVTKEQKDDNYEFYNSVNNDGNIYVCVNKRDNRIARMEAFYALEVIPKGFYKNIIRGYDVYSRYYLLKEGVGYPYTEILNNSKMFLVMAADDTNQKHWEEYLSKRNGCSVELQLVKTVNNRNVYKVMSKE